MSETVRVAVVQAAPRPFDREAAVLRVRELALEAARRGARLALFPEAYIPAYPWGLIFGTRVGGRSEEGRRLWQRYWENAVAVDEEGDVAGSARHALSDAAREAGLHLAVGVVERDARHSRGTLYCTLLHFGPDGRLLGRHRKLKPTAAERIIWGEGDGSTLPVVATPLGRVGGLICWENYMPLARMALYDRGVEIYLAPTADARDAWQATMRHIAVEGRCFVLGCNQYVTRDLYPADLPGLAEVEGLDRADGTPGRPKVLCRGGSVIVGPLGDVLAGPLWDEEGILTADLDMGALPRAKFDFDVVGHYARPDVFRLIVNEAPAEPVERQGAGEET